MLNTCCSNKLLRTLTVAIAAASLTENAGLENADHQNCRGRKCGSGKCGTDLAFPEIGEYVSKINVAIVKCINWTHIATQ